jgi:hypothetical protein
VTLFRNSGSAERWVVGFLGKRPNPPAAGCRRAATVRRCSALRCGKVIAGPRPVISLPVRSNRAQPSHHDRSTARAPRRRYSRPRIIRRPVQRRSARRRVSRQPTLTAKLVTPQVIAVMMLCCDPPAFALTAAPGQDSDRVIRQRLKADRRFALANTRWPPPSIQCALGADWKGRARRWLQGLFRRSGC